MSFFVIRRYNYRNQIPHKLDSTSKLKLVLYYPQNMPKKISFVIPVKNEAGSVEILYKEIVREVKKLKSKYEIIFIDDGSTDNTFSKIKYLTKKDSKVKVLKLRGNWGKSVGLTVGFQNA